MEFASSQVAIAIFITFLAGFSSAIGSVIAFFARTDNLRFLSIGLGFSAGVMIYISFMEILPQSFQDFTNIYGPINGKLLALFCCFAGILICAVIDRCIPADVNLNEPKPDKEYEELQISAKHHHRAAILKRTGIFTAIAIAMHNIPEGFATFVAAMEDISFGIVIAFAIAIHNIPEGMAVSLPIYHATNDKKKAFIYSALSGLAEPMGAIAGIFLFLPFLGELSLAIAFAFTAGVMIFISFDELLPSAHAYGKIHDPIYGAIAGMFVMALSLVMLS